MRWPAVACIFILLVLLAGASNAAAGHFTITYTIGSPHEMDDSRLLKVLEGAYDRVNGCFGTCPGHVEVIIVDDKAMDEEAGEQVDAFSAWNKMMSAMVLRQNALKNISLPVVVEHEMTHLAINDILCKKDPREFQWMEEGICTFVSKEPLGDTDVSKYIVGHGFLDTGDIRDAIKNENCTISKNGYMQSYSLVKHIVQRYGMSAVINMLECPETGLDEAFRQCTGEDFRTFYEEWEKGVMTAASE
jgi:hypothetical protein